MNTTPNPPEFDLTEALEAIVLLTATVLFLYGAGAVVLAGLWRFTTLSEHRALLMGLLVGFVVVVIGTMLYIWRDRARLLGSCKARLG